MELDDLKNIIKSKGIGISDNKINTSLKNIKKQKSNNPVEKLQKKIVIEYLVGIPILITMYILLAIFDKYINKYTIWSFIVLGISLMFYSGWFILKIHRMTRYNDTTVEFLHNFLNAFETYLKLAERSILFLLPLFYFLGYVTGVQLGAPADYKEIMFKPKSLAIMFSTMIFITFLLYRLIKYSYKNIYRKNLKEIRELIDEIGDQKYVM